MSSPKQIQANQLNSRKSTGPTTKTGKSSSSKNSIKHGLLSKETVLPWEDSEELSDLAKGIQDSLQPEGSLETLLVDRIISIFWRLKRAGRIETGIFSFKRYLINYDLVRPKKHKKGSNILEDESHAKTIDAINTYPDMPELGAIFIEESDALNKLSRYETTLERSLVKAIHELQRLQSARNGQYVPPPIAVDITGEPEP